MNRDENLRFIANSSTETLASALLQEIDPDATSPFKFDGLLPLSLDLRTLFRADPAHRELIKSGITSAIHDWTLAHGLDGLRQLALAAAYVRASEVVPVLVRLIDSGRLRGFQSWAKTSEDLKNVIETMVRVIAGFAPMPSVRLAFDRWLFDPRFQPRYAAVLTTGLCNCKPDDYRRYLMFFWEINEPLAMPTTSTV